MSCHCHVFRWDNFHNLCLPNTSLLYYIDKCCIINGLLCFFTAQLLLHVVTADEIEDLNLTFGYFFPSQSAVFEKEESQLVGFRLNRLCSKQSFAHLASC